MSSPLSSLKKSKKNPLPAAVNQNGNRPVPFRYPDYSGVSDASDQALLHEISAGMASSRIHGNQTPVALPKIKESHGSLISASTGAPSDLDLMSTMISKVTQLEHATRQQSREIIEKDKKIKILEEKISLLQKAKWGEKDGSTVSSDQHSRELEKKCLLLEQQVHEMESFLADYGMMWVGDKSDPESKVYNNQSVGTLTEEGDDEEGDEDAGGEPMWRPASSVSSAGDVFQVDFDLILENISVLNSVAGEGQAKVQHTTGGARLKMPDPIPLVLYSNGLVLFSGPFRPFSDPTTQRCVQDLTDGYFPSELQPRYPDGIPFTVGDKRHVFFRCSSVDAFKGAGQMLGGETKPSRLVPSNLDKATQRDDNPEGLQEETQLPGHKKNLEQFLNQLPSSVIRDGKVIDIRNSLSETIKGGPVSTNTLTVVDTPVVVEMKERLAIEKRKRPPTPRNLTTLRIKSERGDHVYVLKMRFRDTIRDVKRCLDNQRSKGSPAYQLLSAFPSRAYTDPDATLEDCGLIPNAALHLKPISK